MNRRAGCAAALGLLAALAPAARADEAAAVEALQKLGAKVTRDDKQPGKPVVAVNLADCRKVTDADLKGLKDLPDLRELNLGGTPVTDAGMKELKDLKNLRTLGLVATKATEAGLKELKGLTGLQTLYLGDGPAVTDAALAALREAGLLHALSQAEAKDGKRPSGPADVLTLDLHEAKVTDAGMKELKDLKNLQSLDLGATDVTDAGLKELKGLKDLRKLSLAHTPVTNAGLKELKELKDLRTLLLFDTGVTEAGVAELRKALPDLNVVR